MAYKCQVYIHIIFEQSPSKLSKVPINRDGEAVNGGRGGRDNPWRAAAVRTPSVIQLRVTYAAHTYLADDPLCVHVRFLPIHRSLPYVYTASEIQEMKFWRMSVRESNKIADPIRRSKNQAARLINAQLSKLSSITRQASLDFPALKRMHPFERVSSPSSIEFAVTRSADS